MTIELEAGFKGKSYFKDIFPPELYNQTIAYLGEGESLVIRLGKSLWVVEAGECIYLVRYVPYPVSEWVIKDRFSLGSTWEIVKKSPIVD